eukprot:gene15860-17847_t
MNCNNSGAEAIASFPSHDIRNGILHEAVAAAHNLLTHGKNVRTATIPISRALHSFYHVERNELAAKMNEACAQIKFKAHEVSAALKEIESRLAEQRANLEDLREASHEDALLLTRLHVALEIFHEAIQETITHSQQVAQHPAYAVIIDDPALEKIQQLQTDAESCFNYGNSVTHLLPLIEVDDVFPTGEEKKAQLEDSINYVRIVSDYANHLLQDELSTRLCELIEDCGEGGTLVEDTTQITENCYHLLNVLAMSQRAISRANHYLEQPKDQKNSIAPQEEAFVFASIEVTAPLLRDAADQLGATLHHLAEKYQTEWPHDISQLLEKLKIAETPYQEFMKSQAE